MFDNPWFVAFLFAVAGVNFGFHLTRKLPYTKAKNRMVYGGTFLALVGCAAAALDVWLHSQLSELSLWLTVLIIIWIFCLTYLDLAAKCYARAASWLIEAGWLILVGVFDYGLPAPWPTIAKAAVTSAVAVSFIALLVFYFRDRAAKKARNAS